MLTRQTKKVLKFAPIRPILNPRAVHNPPVTRNEGYTRRDLISLLEKDHVKPN